MKTRRAKTMQITGSRELHLIDIENEIGKAEPTATEVAQFRDFYLAFNRVAQDAHIVIGASSPLALLAISDGWPNARRVYKQGKDGADLALLQVINQERIHERFAKIVIASGDGIFADVAQELHVRGKNVSVFSHVRSISHQFGKSGERVNLYGPLDFVRSNNGAHV